MEDLTKKEIKGITGKFLAWLLGSVIIIEFSVVMSYATIINQLKNNNDNLSKMENKQERLEDKQKDIDKRLIKVETELDFPTK